MRKGIWMWMVVGVVAALLLASLGGIGKTDPQPIPGPQPGPEPEPRPTNTVWTFAGPGGSISAGGVIGRGQSLEIKITPYYGYEIEDVVVDRVSIGPVDSYTVRFREPTRVCLPMPGGGERCFYLLLIRTVGASFRRIDGSDDPHTIGFGVEGHEQYWLVGASPDEDARYELGTPIELVFSVLDATDEAVTGTLCPVGLIRIDLSPPGIVYLGLAEYCEDAGLFTHAIPTAGLEPGVYAVHISTRGASVFHVLEVVAPPGE